MLAEQWQPVPGHESTYEVSSYGRVRSLDRWVSNPNRVGQRLVRGRVLRPTSSFGGYPMVSLWTEGVQHPSKVHRLVARVFLGPCPADQEVCHWDGNPANNRVDNLRYDTRASNSADTVRHGRCHLVGDGTCPLGHRVEGDNVNSAGGCKACHRARATVRYAAKRGTDLDLQAEADAALKRILSGNRRALQKY